MVGEGRPAGRPGAALSPHRLVGRPCRGEPRAQYLRLKLRAPDGVKAAQAD